MTNIILHVKNDARGRDHLKEFEKSILENGSDIRLEVQPPSKEPIISGASLGPEMQELANEIIQMLHADSIVRITIEAYIGELAIAAFKSVKNKLVSFIGANNKQKGNAWGAKLEIKKDLGDEKVQTWLFFLDKIPENSLFPALEKIDEKINDVTSLVGENYAKEIKNIGFTYDINLNKWDIMGIEKFDGTVELL